MGSAAVVRRVDQRGTEIRLAAAEPGIASTHVPAGDDHVVLGAVHAVFRGGVQFSTVEATADEAAA
jgi:hypothetical protein